MPISDYSMAMRWFGTLAAVAGCFLGGATHGAEVVTYPAPAGETLSADYEVWAEGEKVDVYTARVLDPPFAGKQWDFGGAYSFANFDMSGKVTLRITSPRSLRNTVVRPQSPAVGIKMQDEHTLLLTLDGPRKLSIEPDGKKCPLLLFANPVEKDPPKAKDAGVIYFGPGIHKAGLITVRDNQTLYLAGGAVVHGAVAAQGTNIRICGRGILDGSDYEWRKGPHSCTIGINGANVELSGITVRGSPHWTIVPRGSRHVTIRNVKLCNSRVQNDDGINPCNSQDVRITDCFIRSDDDCIALKGLDFKGENNNVEGIVVENSILWCDRARIFLLGHESRAEFMRQVTFRNLDILHFSMTPFLLEPGEDMRLEDVRIEDVRIHGEGQGELIRLRPVVNQYMRKKVPGFIRNVRFKNLQVDGKAGPYEVQLAGADAEHDVRKVTFENVSILGVPLVRESPRVSIGTHVSEVQFGVPAAGTVPAQGAQARLSAEQKRAKYLELQQTVPLDFLQKQYGEAEKKCLELIELVPKDPGAQYNLACARARLGKIDQSLAGLEKAVALGFDDGQQMRSDPDLETLRKDLRLESIIRRAQALGAEHIKGTYEKPADMEGVKTVERQPEGGLRYHLRMPLKASKAQPARLVVWLHPSGGSANGAAESLVGRLTRNGYALLVPNQKRWMGWSEQEMERLLEKSLPDAGQVEGIDPRKPILLGFSAGGQAALILWSSNPARLGGLIVDAAYPVRLEADPKSGRIGQAMLGLPDTPAVKSVPIYVLVGEADQGGRGLNIWRNVEPQWRKAGVPLTIHAVPGKGHQWLVGPKEADALEVWLKEIKTP